MPAYLLLLYEGPPKMDLGPEEMQKIFEKYMVWVDGLREDGRLLGSNKLRDGEGRVLRREKGRVRVLDGPFSETKEIVGGYIAFEASGYDEAVEISQGCPHLDFGGVVEIREVEH